MDHEGHQMSIGWPLGLMANSRIGRVDGIGAASIETRLLLASNSFSFSSMISSSALDTESSGSFFHDRSRSLGRLIGIRPGDGGRLYFPGSKRYKEPPMLSKQKRANASKRICLPLLLDILLKANRNKKRTER